VPRAKTNTSKREKWGKQLTHAKGKEEKDTIHPDQRGSWKGCMPTKHEVENEIARAKGEKRP